MKKIMTGLLLTLALLSNVVFSAEEAHDIPTSITTANPYVSLKDLNLILKTMTIEELFVEADAWLALLNEVAEKVEDTERLLQQKIAMATKEKAAMVETLTKLRTEKKTMLARLDTVLENINEQYKVNYTNISNGTLDMKNVDDLDECEELLACEDQS